MKKNSTAASLESKASESFFVAAAAVVAVFWGWISLLSKCLPKLGAPLLDCAGCFASGPPASLAAGPCCLQTRLFSRTDARKPQLARFSSTTHVSDRLYPTHTLLWCWPRTPTPRKRLLRS